MGLWYPKDTGFELTAFSDSDHAGCLDSRKSTSGGIQFLGSDKLVSWSSKKQDYYGFHFDKIPMYCDSKAAIAISCNPVQHSRTKHIDVRYHFIKEKQQLQQQLQQQSQQLQQQSQQQIEQNTKILEALNIREQPKHDHKVYGSSSDEDEEGGYVDPVNQLRNCIPRIKADIPTFSGSLNIEDFLDWVSETEKYFELMDIPEDSQVKYVTYKLRGAASSWWDNLQTTIICLQTTWTLDEAVRMTLKAEHTVSKGKNNSKLKSKPDLNQSLNQSGEKTQPLNSNEAEKNKSTYASTSSHATKKPTNQYARPVGNKCFKCQKTGHTSNQCRAEAVNVTKQGELYEEESENEECFIRPEDVLDEEEDGEHEAYSYVVRRLMLTTLKKVKTPNDTTSFEHDVGSIKTLSTSSLMVEVVRISSHENPDGLPPLRDIQHQIDFVPRDSLPNLPHYPVIANFEFIPEMNGRLLLRQKKAFMSRGNAFRAFKSLEHSNTEDEQLDHLREVIKVLQAHQLFVNLKKCSFVSHKLLFLGFVVSADGIHVDDENIKVIRNGMHLRQLVMFKVLMHKAGTKNKVADALSRRETLLITMGTEGISFDCLKDLYVSDDDLLEVWKQNETGIPGGLYLVQDGFLFFKDRLCIPRGSFREHLLQELHGGGLDGHLSREKTIKLVKERYHWPQIKRDVNNFVKKCYICQTNKGQSQNTGLYTPLPILKAPWEDTSMDFVFGLPRTQRSSDSVFVVDVLHITGIFFREVVRLHRVPKTITFDRDTKFFDRPKHWDICLAPAEFAYNNMVNHSTAKTPFSVVYQKSPNHMLDLVPLPKILGYSIVAKNFAKKIEAIQADEKVYANGGLVKHKIYEIARYWNYTLDKFVEASMIPYEKLWICSPRTKSKKYKGPIQLSWNRGGYTINGRVKKPGYNLSLIIRIYFLDIKSSCECILSIRDDARQDDASSEEESEDVADEGVYQIDINHAAGGKLKGLSDEEAWETIEDSVQYAYDEPIGDLDMMKDKTLGTPIEVEPLDETQLEDLGLNTCNHDLPLSSMKVLSFDELEPQPQPLPNRPPLDVSLRNKRGLEPHSLDSFRLKVVDQLTIHIPPSPHVAYYHPSLGDPKKHYGFKPSLLGHGGSLGVDFSKLEMIEDDFLREGLSLPVRPKVVGKQNQGDVNDALGYKKKSVVVTSDPLALVAEKTKVKKRKKKVEVQTESEGSDDEDISDLKKITALLAKAFNRKKYYAKPTNTNLRTSSASSSANKKPKYVKSVEKKEDKKADEKKRDMSKVKCYNCKKEGHFAKDCKKSKVKDYNYYKTKMLLANKDSDEQVLLTEDQAWMESSSDSDQEINANMVFIEKMEKVLSNSDKSYSFAEEIIAEVAYYTYESESESEYETSEYYDNSTNYGLL
uniref:CCHC-type domain-containing protein n=1 Tax=Tanacetum cinerariifolium TaxID=118510 RepID=A0A6L2M479_TANCI|nr:hypothetical protein [Tanacetum cinerariifolium]